MICTPHAARVSVALSAKRRDLVSAVDGGDDDDGELSVVIGDAPSSRSPPPSVARADRTNLRVRALQDARGRNFAHKQASNGI